MSQRDDAEPKRMGWLERLGWVACAALTAAFWLGVAVLAFRLLGRLF